ncbi:hypothetical protein GCM10018980_38480 [Streptomyces capoamus]|uniref:DUF7848 domain-containing protein n=1 Tax=Streptomyces capoamus TaxID=68183 RepID=A0A919C5F3_9ACTN|nr:hypothetical protein GCM10010501_27660 [Streptomyces libani subsp. rufus]GHG54152.1 hypothetical protein GCM10018980_38480 [Streptomyces capoamus]
MTRATYRFREHTLTPDTDKPTLHAMECQACGQASTGSADPTDGTRWAADHLKANPGHLTYQEHIERSYRFEPGAWQ